MDKAKWGPFYYNYFALPPGASQLLNWGSPNPLQLVQAHRQWRVNQWTYQGLGSGSPQLQGGATSWSLGSTKS